MKTVRLGKTDLEVSAAGFGGIPIQRLSTAEAERLLHRTLDLSVNFIDTATGYGDSQKKIGRVVEDRRDEVVLATKSPARTGNDMQGAVEKSLREMCTDYIDLYQLHNISNPDNWEEVQEGGALDVLLEKSEEGTIGHVGFTSHSLEMALKLIEDPRMETVQFPFNLVTSEAADELIPRARELDRGFIVMKPLCGGQYTNADFAFKYLNSFPDLVPIPGVERFEEIDEIAGLVDSRQILQGEEAEEASRVAEALGQQFCRRCGYCEPCPEGVPVTLAMIFESMVARLSRERLLSGPAKKMYEKGDHCIECGQCEERCPYDLPIIDSVRDAHRQARNIVEGS
ncbi:MAG: aldo/keto reductase [Planctomycetota bacterium]